MGIRVGIDIGGTFTDLIAVVEESGDSIIVKTPSTPFNPAIGFMDALEKSEIDPEKIVDIVHGTTVGTNAILERKGSKVGLLCTEGFRDVLEIRRLWREHLFGNWWERPESLVERRLRRGVRERIDYKGNVVIPLDEEQVKETVEFFKAEGVNSYAVSLLYSFINPKHEQRIKEIIKEIHPDAFITISSEVLPEIREYERTSTTVISAMLKPVMSTYVDDVERKIFDFGAKNAVLRIMNSNGGLMTPQAVSENAVGTFMSGPAGGLTAAQFMGKLIKSENIITFDMGGTSTDVGIIYDKEPLFTMEQDLEWNIPVRSPMLDIKSIGAGGGSIAWIDSGGALQVGPQSSGAEPGPVCYDHGGTEPTVTDANLILGRIDPNYFLGGTVKLNYDKAAKALTDLGKHFKWNALETANAIYKISLSNMALLLREMTINRGYDPRDFTLMSFGGAGGLYAADLARELDIPKVCVPMSAGVYSAIGGLMADLKYDYVRSYYKAIDDLELKGLEAICEDLGEQARLQLKNDRINTQSYFEYFLDLRYIGESFELTIPLNFTKLTEQDIENTISLFHKEHSRLYGFNRPIEPVELVSVRLRLTANRPKPPVKKFEKKSNTLDALKGYRDAYFGESQDLIKTPIYARDLLGYGGKINGPAVIEEIESTTVVFPGQTAFVDEYGNIIIELR
ncbi:MAG TPA: hydantoinase/oxoprolinase family protein [Thermoanaerobacterales bacterium]|nr:hydantoinase/oxoprolinase family protein [Thermoanaerobacterales bacterium]